MKNVCRLMGLKKKRVYIRFCSKNMGGCGELFKPVAKTQKTCKPCQKKKRLKRLKKEKKERDEKKHLLVSILL